MEILLWGSEDKMAIQFCRSPRREGEAGSPVHLIERGALGGSGDSLDSAGAVGKPALNDDHVQPT